MTTLTCMVKDLCLYKSRMVNLHIDIKFIYISQSIYRLFRILSQCAPPFSSLTITTHLIFLESFLIRSIYSVEYRVCYVHGYIKICRATLPNQLKRTY